MSAKSFGLLGDIKTANVFHHSVKAKISDISSIRFLIAHIIAHFHVI